MAGLGPRNKFVGQADMFLDLVVQCFRLEIAMFDLVDTAAAGVDKLGAADKSVGAHKLVVHLLLVRLVLVRLLLVRLVLLLPQGAKRARRWANI